MRGRSIAKKSEGDMKKQHEACDENGKKKNLSSGIISQTFFIHRK
jgi:hypothetical protein